MPQSQTVALPKRLPLILDPSNRDASSEKDAKLVNGYLEIRRDGEIWIFKRPCTTAQSQPPGTAAAGLGLWHWLGDSYAVFGNKLYKNGVAVAGTVDTTGGVYRFDSCLGAVPKMQLGNGVKAYNYDAANGLVLINDADFPAAFVKGWSYLDSTTYVMTPAAVIQNDGINDPTSWNALDKIVANIEPDGGVALAKQLVYVIAMKQWSTEVFYDAANAVGSPLGTVQGAKSSWGCVSADSVREMDGTLLWLATNRSSAIAVVRMDNLKVERVSTPAVERLLDDLDTTVIYSWTHKDQGHRFYIITSKLSNLTLAYDLDEDRWHQWTDTNGNYVPIVSSTYTTDFEHLVQHESDGRLYTLDEEAFTDNGQLISVDLVTPNTDLGTRRRKLMNRLEFVGDQVTESELLVRYSDDDYQTWSDWISVDLGSEQPMLTELGTFKRRAHHFRHRSNTPFRLQAVEMQLDLGTL